MYFYVSLDTRNYDCLLIELRSIHIIYFLFFNTCRESFFVFFTKTTICILNEIVLLDSSEAFSSTRKSSNVSCIQRITLYAGYLCSRAHSS